ncbi:MAG: hypothetical protein ABII89_06035 [Candidatus Omnitrophota bacterium]
MWLPFFEEGRYEPEHFFFHYFTTSGDCPFVNSAPAGDIPASISVLPNESA